MARVNMDAVTLFAERFTPPAVGSGGGLCIPSLTGAADAFLALALSGQPRSNHLVLALTPGIPEATRLAHDLRTIPSRARIHEFPPHLDGDMSALGLRIKTIAAVRAWSLAPHPAIIVAPYPALCTPIAHSPVDVIALPGHSFASLCERLAKAGYTRTAQVSNEGEYSVRGGIVDAWSPSEEFPVRAEFFGEDLESIRAFDPGAQTSIERLSSTTLLPITEHGSDEANDTPQTLFDILPTGTALLALEHNDYDLSAFPIAEHFQNIIYTGDPAPCGVPSYAFQTAPLPGFAELGADEAHHPELFDAARQRLERHLAAATQRGDTVIHLDDLSGGFELPGLIVVSKADRVFTKRHHTASFARRGTAAHGPRINDFEELEPGEYVVHLDYGVGRYIGSSEILIDKHRTEVYTIEYADGKLHIPAVHAHLLTRYVGVKGESVPLHRLDGKRWAKDKAAAQKSVSDLAAALLETQARRETVPGFAYDVACDGLDAFEAAFPYDETSDQRAAIAAIKKDLAARKPMDRLICGDAGYGKTEVAMRAAFIAAMNGKQVAVLAPTTVLAEQHFETFTARFDGTPIRIESMSRFQSASTHKGTFQRLATGACDIVIGTHAILSNKMAFRDLGLIIIDEEQRFGVRHKEFLKRLRATADVLTLSATPIPRTLYLSMTGARDLSLLRSPPRERVAVETQIVTDSDEIIRVAIEAELTRGGQVFFLHNRVTTIGKVEKRLNAIFAAARSLPRAPRIVVAHGQMDARTLARKMRDFERGDYDILLSTTIVESGIDIPRANTILIDHAEMLGLADLYQLRGRVGRSAQQGHAIFLLPTGGLVDSDARERLQALKRHGGLGSGFNLAVRDLELRGAGNLLGSQQSGHIAAVGFTLYCQLLQRTVAALKGEKIPDLVEVKFNLAFITLSPAPEDAANAAALPYDYVEEDIQRMSFMKRLAEATDEKIIKALADELKDRFGPLPPAARRLIRLARLRLCCARAGIGDVVASTTRALFYRAGTRDIAKDIDLKSKTPDRLIAEITAAIATP